MSLGPDDIDQIAHDLFIAEQRGVQIGLISQRFPRMTMNDAYAIQNALVAHKQSAGGQIRGWKIGLTSRAMQQALNIDIPDSGVLFDDMFFASGGTVAKGRFIQPRIEAEIAFVMKTALPGSAGRADVLAATESVCPALEILDTRISRLDPTSGQPRKVFDTIADNAANAGIVLGDQRHAPDVFDLRWVGAIVSRNGTVEETGLGAGVLNDPVQGIVWLAERLATNGQKIRAGDVVLSGSFIRPLEAPSGSRFSADYGPFGHVEITFD
jgi:2-oxo-hept-3-ene-1,7-dioate hydratase